MGNIRVTVFALLAAIAGIGIAAGVARGQTFELMHSFGAPASDPRGPLITLLSGVLYGTTTDGGAFNRGSIYSLTPDGSGGFTNHTIHSLSARTAANPRAA